VNCQDLTPKGMKDRAMEVLRHAEYGLYLVTAAHAGEINGMPLSLFTQVSFDPPQVAIGVSPRRYTHHLILQAKSFAVIFLRQDQKSLTSRFKSKDPDRGAKFQGLKWQPGQTGAPLLHDCLGWVECKLVGTYAPGDHTLFVGEVVAAKLVQPGKLLLTSAYGKNSYYAG